MSDRTIEDLRYLQALPLEMKVEMTKARIMKWTDGKVVREITLEEWVKSEGGDSE